MWRIEAQLEAPEARYDRRAALYDRLVRSGLYNRLAWSTSPEDYTRFAAAAIGSGTGPLLEVAVGTAAATAGLHARSGRSTVLVDLSRAMLERAARNIVLAGDHDEQQLPGRIRLVQADLFDLTLPEHGFTTVLGLGVTHLFDDVRGLVQALRRHLAPDGQLHVSGLVAETGRGRRYLHVLHRAGEVTQPRTAAELDVLLDHPETFHTTGCMAYATIPADEHMRQRRGGT